MVLRQRWSQLSVTLPPYVIYARRRAGSHTTVLVLYTNTDKRCKWQDLALATTACIRTTGTDSKNSRTHFSSDEDQGIPGHLSIFQEHLEIVKGAFAITVVEFVLASNEKQRNGHKQMKTRGSLKNITFTTKTLLTRTHNIFLLPQFTYIMLQHTLGIEYTLMCTMDEQQSCSPFRVFSYIPRPVSMANGLSKPCNTV